MRLWPWSLFGQLTLVLFTGLILAQLVSAAISLSERDQVLFHFSDLQWAQRIAQTVRARRSTVSRMCVTISATSRRSTCSLTDGRRSAIVSIPLPPVPSAVTMISSYDVAGWRRSLRSCILRWLMITWRRKARGLRIGSPSRSRIQAAVAAIWNRSPNASRPPAPAIPSGRASVTNSEF